MLGWQESTLKIHILELYDAFDNLVTVATVSKYKVVTMFVQPCDNLATILSQPCDSFKIQGCAKVVTRLHCGNLVTMFGQPCHNLATVSKYKVVPRLCQGCDKVVKKHCGNLVPRL